jgi:CysZ protein
VRGFVDGFFAVFRGLRFLVRTKRAWPFALVPAVVLVALSLLGLFVAIQFVAPALIALLPPPSSSFGRFGVFLLRGLAIVVAFVASVVVAASCAPVIAGPALERIILLREKDLGLPEREPVPFFTEIACGLRAQLLAFAVGAPVFTVLWLLTLAFPPIAVVTLPLKLATALVLLVWSLLDYPLSMRGVRLRDRLTLLRGQAPAAVGFGVGITLFFAIPVGAIVLLPVAVAAATELVSRTPRSGSPQERS